VTASRPAGHPVQPPLDPSLAWPLLHPSPPLFLCRSSPGTLCARGRNRGETTQSVVTEKGRGAPPGQREAEREGDRGELSPRAGRRRARRRGRPRGPMSPVREGGAASSGGQARGIRGNQAVAGTGQCLRNVVAHSGFEVHSAERPRRARRIGPGFSLSREPRREPLRERPAARRPSRAQRVRGGMDARGTRQGERACASGELRARTYMA
jgi:hypothetical protein